ncbi:MAG: hypothetical protein JO112_21890, partial [Planctomycetes bacterium]|nr:hypothetical protein [Planctomycetota bacterium]
MAFNPFRAFRKHQKVMFAVLTIFCMFIFVLTGSSMGGWDYFMDLFRFFGAGPRLPQIATLYGKDVDKAEIMRLRRDREIANQFMDVATAAARDREVRMVLEATSKWDEKQQQVIKQAVGARNFVRQYPQFRSYFLQQQFPDLERQLNSLWFELIHTNKRDEADLVRRLYQVLVKENQVASRPKGELFFGGTVKVESLLDFLIWSHQADRLGITLTKKSVDDLINNDTQKLLSNADFTSVDGAVKNTYGKYSTADLLSALNAEYRVQLAKKAILGGSSESALAEAVDVTPYEVWQFYRENRTQRTVGLLAIPVDNKEFLSKVPAPSVAELKAFFEKYKDQVSSPSLPTPGFKQPSRIQVQWVKPDQNGFTQKAAAVNTALRAAFQVAGGSGVPSAEGALPASLVPAAVPLVFNTQVIGEYTAYRTTQYKAPALTSPDFALLYNPSLTQPGGSAALVASGAAGMPGAGYLSALIGLGTALAHQDTELTLLLAQETHKRAMVDLSLVLSGASPVPLAPALIWEAAGSVPQYLPLEVVKTRLVEKDQNEKARQLAQDAINHLKTQMETWDKVRTTQDALNAVKLMPVSSVLGTFGVTSTGAPGLGAPALLAAGVANRTPLGDKTFEDARIVTAALAAQSVLAPTQPAPVQVAALTANGQSLPLAFLKAPLNQLLQEKSLVAGASQAPRDAFDIAQDKGLQVLKEAYVSSLGPNVTGSQDRQFADQFFNQANPNHTETYVPETLSTAGDPILYWNTAVNPAYVPTFEEARPKVETAWKLDKARPLAKAEAEKLARAAHESGQPMQNLRDAGQRFGVEPTQLSSIAPLLPTANGGFTPFALPMDPRERVEPPVQSLLAAVDYPTPETVDDLLALKDKGEVKVFTNGPQTRYNVAALLFITPPQVQFFYED